MFVRTLHRKMQQIFVTLGHLVCTPSINIIWTAITKLQLIMNAHPSIYEPFNKVL